MVAHFVSLLVATALLFSPVKARTLFPYEQQQLTRDYVASLPEEDAQLIAFEGQFETDENSIEAVNATDKRCRYDPTDKKWPSEKAWNKLKKQLSSPEALISAVPQAAVCYNPTKNDAGCQQLTSNWTNPYTHIDDPTEVISPLYQGLSCQPPSRFDSGSCTLGGYPAYVIKAKTVSDIQCGINFARNDNLRLIVKNTGHDLAGKSLGYGAISIWTHGFKDIQFFDNYVDESGYRGPAIKAGAGVQAFELYKFASQNGVVAVSGECKTVGIFGGYILGGGHSPLSSLYGMAADHVLGFEVVSPIGEFITANSTSNQDLFWALQGGGGSTFGVVTSVTIKVYKDMPVSTASWTLESAKIGKDKFWAATKAYFDRAIDNVDAGTYSYFTVLPIGQDFTFTIQPLFAPNKTAAQLSTILGPYSSRLTSLNIPFNPKITQYASFYPAWQSDFPDETSSDFSLLFASRIFPRSNFVSETGRNTTFAVLQKTVESGSPLFALNFGARAPSSTVDNAVNPAWRTAVYHIATGKFVQLTSSTAVSTLTAARAALTNGTMASWRGVTPNSGAYLNEADRLEPDWQKSFWGDKYERLLAIKREMDHRDVFWVHHGVGSEGWTIENREGGAGVQVGEAGENGKLCKVA